jgi:outer membrane protein assembly factor BamB
MPLPGRNSPVVWGGRVFLTGADKSAREVFCWDTATGKLLWRTPVPVPAGSGPAVVADTAGYAPNTMAVNGSAAFAVFPNGDITALSFSGAIIWIRSLGPLDLNYGYASSPALCGDSLIIQLDQSEGGRLLCIKAEDGATRWEARRNVAACWASPIVTGSGKDARIFVNGTPVLTAYEAASGRELWSLEGMMGENAPSPAFADGRVFSSNQLLSLAAANAATGEKRWEVYEDFPDVASPLAIPGGLLIMAASYGVVSCLDAASGDVLWKSEFTTGFYASPLFAAGRIYALDRNGVMRILAADRALKIIGSPAIGEHTEATPAIRGSEIFIRGDRHLFCIGGRDGL